MDTFETLYHKLNKAQRKAVDAVEGPTIVLAGPGTGKTQILALRIANILRKTDASADSILALTFTDAGAVAMRERLVSLIGAPAYRVHVDTYHGFCNTLIGEYAEYFPRIIGGRAITDIERIRMFEKIIDEGDFLQLKPFGNPYHYLIPLQSIVSVLKREEVSPDEFEIICKRDLEAYEEVPEDEKKHVKGPHKGKIKGAYQEKKKYIDRNFEVLTIYREYETALTKEHLYDYEDMILAVIRALEHYELFLQLLQEKYQYILADEHQDANSAQNRLLELIACYFDSPNLFLVGDSKQAIYRFQGAQVENFDYFQRRFRDVQMIPLEENYRSTQTILDAAFSLTTHHGFEGIVPETRLMAKAQNTGEKVSIAMLNATSEEVAFLAHNVRTYIARGTALNEIAILCRTNRDVLSLALAMRTYAITCATFADENLLDDPTMSELLSLVEAVVHYGDDEKLARALHLGFLNIPQADVFRVIRYAGERRKDMVALMADRVLLRHARVHEPEALSVFAHKMKEWNTFSLKEDPLASLERIAHDSGFVSFLVQSVGKLSAFRKLNELYRQTALLLAENHRVTLFDVLEHFTLLKKYAVRIKTPFVKTEGIQIMTAHRSKGLEFDHVFLYNVHDRNWGEPSMRSSFRFRDDLPALASVGDVSDERRLFYVALTRARKSATISYALHGNEARQRIPSRFIGEINEAYRENIDTSFATKELIENVLNPNREEKTPESEDREFLRGVFLRQGLSVTALNNYVVCPWRFFYRNLIRVPQAPNKHLAFGNAMHETLHEVFKQLKKGGRADNMLAKDWFTRALDRQPVGKADFDELLQKGKQVLDRYVEAYASTWNTNTVTEYRIDGVFFPLSIDGEVHRLPLRGSLDKIELLPDGMVNVVDYKTGKHKSRNAIEGNTKGSDGAYKRQLVFYKLLLDSMVERKYAMKTGEIDFLEPDPKTGRHRKEKFEITKEDVADITALIENVSSEIYSLGFWDKQCQEKTCEYCAMRTFAP